MLMQLQTAMQLSSQALAADGQAALTSFHNWKAPSLPDNPGLDVCGV